MNQRVLPLQLLSAALAITAGLLCAAPAAAQTRAALVQSIDEPGRNPYQEVVSDLGCRTTTVCSFNFATVPAGKRLVVTHIAGYVDTAGGTLPNNFLHSSIGGSGYPTLPFTGVRGPNTPLGTRIFINHEVLAFFGAGENPRGTYQVFGDTMSGGALLMLTGYYVNLP